MAVLRIILLPPISLNHCVMSSVLTVNALGHVSNTCKLVELQQGSI